jgi:poly-gamma-glutamate synthesis protein (capsule biosynthesis protein)
MKVVRATLGVGIMFVLVAIFFPRLLNAPSAIAQRFKKSDPVILGFGGDMMFDRYIRQKADVNRYDVIFASLIPLLSTPDLVAANLEGPITVFDSLSLYTEPFEQNNFVFTFSPRVSSVLKTTGIDVVNLGNNHTLNFGNAGLSQTEQFLTDAGIAYFGEPFAESTYIKDIRGTRVGFVSFNEFIPPTLDETLASIAHLATTSDFVVVFAHWGYEYAQEPNVFQMELAHTFIDAGADLIVGSHPHVIQTHEVYQGKEIFYSLGNLVFDQYWNNDVRCGLFVTLTINPKDFSYTTATTTVYLQKDGTTIQKECGV